MPILPEVELEKDYIIKTRRWLHEHPELSLEEFETAIYIEKQLDFMGITHTRIGKTGVLGTLQGTTKEGKCIALRADIDALPIKEETELDYTSQCDGVMHACGHDIHTASLLGAAKVLSENRDSFKGEVRFIFQPAEEAGKGAHDFIDAGALKGVDRVFGFHVAPGILTGKIGITQGPLFASVDHFSIEVHGISSHVGAPEKGVDALYVASQIVTNAQAIVSRETNPKESVLVGIGTLNAGTAHNIVADYAKMNGSVRCFTVEARDHTIEALNRLTTNIAKAYEAKARVNVLSYVHAVINPKEVYNEAKIAAAEVVGEENILSIDKVSFSDNFAEYQQEVPGFYALVGVSNKKVPGSFNAPHTPDFNPDEEALLVGSSLHISYALEILA